MKENMVHKQILSTYKQYLLRRMLIDVLSVLLFVIGMIVIFHYLRSEMFSYMSEADMKDFIDAIYAEVINSPATLLIGIFVGASILLVVPKCVIAQVELFQKMKAVKEGQYSVAVEVVKQNFTLQKKYRAYGERQRYRVIHYYRTEENPQINIINGFNMSAFPGQRIYVITFHNSSENSYPDGIKMKNE